MNGLPNVGSNCYINSALQFFFQFYNTQIPKKLEKKDEAFLKYLKIIHISLSNEIRHFRHYYLAFLKLLLLYPNLKQFHFQQQNDSYQFLIQLIDTIHHITKYKVTYKIHSSEHLNPEHKILIKSFHSWIQYHNYEFSSIYERICGQYYNLYVCPSCKKETIQFEVFLSLHLHPKKHKTIQDLIHNEIHETEIKCCDTHKILYQYFIKLPSYLIVYINRYINYPHKNITPIDLNEQIVISQYPNKKKYYTLDAIIYHYGNQHNGHYTMMKKMKHEWYEMDDLHVHKTDMFDTKYTNLLLYRSSDL